ncbi:MAG: hypothetical protein DWQ34_07170 [Planctomycetota bacterium]|nr:MAG: hypothetical protein DWQ29_11245 [Planctomycetota bacterium]REJ94983.1 MAG: hypothetical protein DWQ34_07170 [Planctomycetota bacterium]REK38912.1 MAG: hypothetical protein DWQ45_03455 [Planctomycetota bacterium]
MADDSPSCRTPVADHRAAIDWPDVLRRHDGWLRKVVRIRLGDEYWNAENGIPREVRSAFSQNGYDLDHHRKFYSVPLDDGRRVAAPVDTVQVRYAGL